mgnify:CR=1 FL=1
MAIIPFDESKIFLYYLLNYYRNWIINTYTQGGQPNLSSEIMKSVKLSLPKTEEQKVIANTLSDIDNEIEALEQRMNKTKQIKQGMMQELLTGKIRLNHD